MYSVVVLFGQQPHIREEKKTTKQTNNGVHTSGSKSVLWGIPGTIGEKEIPYRVLKVGPCCCLAAAEPVRLKQPGEMRLLPSSQGTMASSGGCSLTEPPAGLPAPSHGQGHCPGVCSAPRAGKGGFSVPECNCSYL